MIDSWQLLNAETVFCGKELTRCNVTQMQRMSATVALFLTHLWFVHSRTFKILFWSLGHCGGNGRTHKVVSSPSSRRTNFSLHLNSTLCAVAVLRLMILFWGLCLFFMLTRLILSHCTGSVMIEMNTVISASFHIVLTIAGWCGKEFTYYHCFSVQDMVKPLLWSAQMLTKIMHVWLSYLAES